MNFTLPENYQDIIQDTIERMYDLIELGYLNSFDKETLDKWLHNFTNNEEKYLSLQILNHFSYRNEEALIAMFKQILQVSLPQLLENLKIYKITSIDTWLNQLSSEKAYQFPFRFSTINKEGRIGESGDAIFRLYTRYGLIEKGIGRFIDNIGSQYKTIILVDDFTGTGKQFEKFYKKYEAIFEKFSHIIYIPLVAHKNAISNIEQLSSNIYILTVEIISDVNSFYNVKDNLNTNSEYRQLYDKIINKFSKKSKPKFPYGYNNQAILYSFQISTPNNNLSLLYHNKNWQQLFKR